MSAFITIGPLVLVGSKPWTGFGVNFPPLCNGSSVSTIFHDVIYSSDLWAYTFPELTGYACNAQPIIKFITA